MAKKKPRKDKDENKPIEVTSLGSGIKKVKEELVELNHAFAEQHLNRPNWVGERQLQVGYWKPILKAMQRGTFHSELVLLATATCAEPISIYETEADLRNRDAVEGPRGTKVRINGRHTSFARLRMPPEYRCPVRLIHYRCQTFEDVKLLYASFDRGNGRTKSTVVETLLAGEEFWMKTSKLVIKMVASGLGKFVAMQNVSLDSGSSLSSRLDVDEIAYLMKTKFAGLCEGVAAFLDEHTKSGGEGAHVRRSPVVCAMLGTREARPSAFDEFWEVVVSGVGITNKNDPRHRLRNFLMQGKLLSTNASGTKAMSDEEMLRGCIRAWNAWRTGKTLTTISRSSSGNRPRIHK